MILSKDTRLARCRGSERAYAEIAWYQRNYSGTSGGARDQKVERRDMKGSARELLNPIIRCHAASQNLVDQKIWHSDFNERVIERKGIFGSPWKRRAEIGVENDQGSLFDIMEIDVEVFFIRSTVREEISLRLKSYVIIPDGKRIFLIIAKWAFL